MTNRVCKYCSLKAVNGPKCINCDTVFHPKCVPRLTNVRVINNELVECCCEMISEASTEKCASSASSNEIINFLHSADFSKIIQIAVRSETAKLQGEIDDLKVKFDIVVESNKELVRLLSIENHVSFKKSPTNESEKVEVNPTIQPLNSSKTPVDQTPYVKTPQRLEVTKKIPKSLPLNSPTQDDPQPESENDDHTWQVQTHRRKKRPSGIKFGTGNADNILKPVIPKSFIHVSKIGLDCTTDHVTSYIQNKLSDSNLHVDCTELNVKSKEYKSFKVGIPVTHTAQLLDPCFWPKSIAIKKFIHFKEKTKTITPSKTSKMD